MHVHDLFSSTQVFETFGAFATSGAHRGTVGADMFAAHGFQVVCVQTLLAIEETMTLVALQVSGTVTFVRFSMIGVPFLQTGPAMVCLVIRAGMLARRIVGFQAMRAEVAAAE